VLQHEALKAHVLTALAGVIAMTTNIDTITPGRMLPVLDRVLNNACIVEGRNFDASLCCGRDKLLELKTMQGFYSIITHELGHNLLDLLMGKGQGNASGPHETALTDLAAALPKLMEAACRRRGRQFEINDACSFLAATGVRLLCTHEQRDAGEYFHMSLMHDGGPIDLHTGAMYVLFVLTIAGVDPQQAAVAWSPRGALHFGFRGSEQDVLRAVPAPAVIAAAAHDASTKGAEWIDELRVDGRLGASELDVAITLGVQAPQPRAYGNDCQRALMDLDLVAQADSLPSLDALTEPQGIAVLAAAWRAAAPTMVQRVLREQPGLPAQLRTAGWPLSEIGASLCALRDENGVVAYYGPTISDIEQVLHALQDSGVPLDGPADAYGRTLLVRAAVKDAKLVQLILDCGADPSRPGADGDTPLLACATVGDVAVAETLAAAGASLESRDSNRRTALHRAAEHGHDELLKLLIARGAEVDARDSDDKTALMSARTPAAVMALCDAGASVLAATGEGMTALHIAAQDDLTEVVRALLSRNADPDVATRMGETALHYAALAGTDCLGPLVDAGADIDEETKEGVTALMVAARNAQLDVVEWLLERGASVNARTVTGNTALIMASDGRNEWTRDFSFNDRIEECLRRLVQAGADVNAVNDEGITAVHAATWGFDAGRVKCLLELGADPRIAALDGTTPLSVAQAKEHEAMVEALTAAADEKGKT
jgi:ankyrin repeat protein